jgi:hypothetical protein
MGFANMSIGERIVLAASLATTAHVLKSVEEQRAHGLKRDTKETPPVDQAAKLREYVKAVGLS